MSGPSSDEAFIASPETWPRLIFASPQWIACRMRNEGQPDSLFVFLPLAMRDRVTGMKTPLPPDLVEPYAELVAEVQTVHAQAAALALTPPTPASPYLKGRLFGHGGTAPKTRLADVTLEPSDAPALARHLARTLDRLHGNGLFHLDLHPDIIGLDDPDAPTLHGMSLDLRSQLARLAPDNRRFARPRFSAPELWDGSARSPLGPWTDVYGAAATLFACLTGEPPPDFRDRIGQPNARDDLAEAINRRLSDRGLRGPAMADAIADGLSPRPSDRPHSILDWAEAFDLAPIGGPTSNAPPPPPETAPDVGDPASAGLDWTLEPEDLEDEPPVAMPSKVRRPGGRGGLTALAALLVLLGGGGLSAYVLRDDIGQWLSPPEVRPVAAAPVETAPKPTTKPRPPPPPPRPVWPNGRIADFAYVDDPDQLKLTLETLGAVGLLTTEPELLFRPYRDVTDEQCAAPLRIHLRADGEGLVIERPVGLTWITEWARNPELSRDELHFTITSVIREGSAIEAPGLIGDSRRLIPAPDEVSIVYKQGDRTERESYQACPGSA